VIALAIGAAGLFYGNLRSDSGAARAALPRWLVAVILVVAVAAGVGTVVQVVRIGHSGAQAAWASVG
jgi:hypothetical protein